MIFFNLFQVHFINLWSVPLTLELRYIELLDTRMSHIFKNRTIKIFSNLSSIQPIMHLQNKSFAQKENYKFQEKFTVR